MTRKPPVRAASGTPGPAAAKSCPISVPPAPAAAGQGDPAPGDALPEALPGAGLDVPGAAAARGGEASQDRSQPLGSQTLAETQKRQLAQIAAARATLARNQRNRRARPWQGRNRFSDAVPGVRVMPPPRDGA